MADTTLERIDATLNQSCACGCGRQLDPDGPSAWWATEGCFKVGTRALTGADSPEIVGRSLREEQLAVAFERLSVQLATVFDVMRSRLNDMFAAIGVALDIMALRRQAITAARLRMFRYKADHRCFEKYWDESTRRTITVEIAHPSQGLRSDGC